MICAFTLLLVAGPGLRADARSSERLSVWMASVSRAALARESMPALDESALRALLPTGMDSGLLAVVARVYRDTGGAPAFLEGAELSPAGRALLSLMRDVESHGLSTGGFALAALAQRAEEHRTARASFERPRARWAPPDDWQPPVGRPPGPEESEALAMASGLARRLAASTRALDVHLVACLIHLLRQTESPSLADRALPRRVSSLLKAWSGDTTVAASLEGLFPGHAQYGRLTQALGRYLDLWRGPPPAPLPEDASLVPGERSASVALLRARLAWEGFLAGDGSSVYDEGLAEAVRAFQRSRGLPVTGVVDAVTLRDLRRPASWWLSKLVLAVERWRSSPLRSAGDTYIRVNIPEFVTELVQGGALVLRMRSLVGQPRTRTRVLASRVHTIRVNPSWNVPEGVQRREIEPRVEREPSFLEDNHFIARGRGAGLRYVQRPGPWNWLGRALLAFSNTHNLALHGTTRRHLFDKEQRAYSNGCVNLEDEVAFVRALLEHDGNPALARLEGWLEGWKSHTVRLRRAVPLFFEYQTVVVEDDGLVRFLPDIYGHDGPALQRVSLERFRTDGRSPEVP